MHCPIPSQLSVLPGQMIAQFILKPRRKPRLEESELLGLVTLGPVNTSWETWSKDQTAFFLCLFLSSFSPADKKLLFLGLIGIFELAKAFLILSSSLH